MPASATRANAQPNPLPTTVHDAFTHGVVAAHRKQAPAEDRAVDRDQGQVDAERMEKPGKKLVEHHFEDLHHRCDDADVGDQTEEAQVDVWEPRPCERAVLEDIVVEKRVRRHGDQLHAHDRSPESEVRYSIRFETARNVHIPRKNASARFSTKAALMKSST